MDAVDIERRPATTCASEILKRYRELSNALGVITPGLLFEELKYFLAVNQILVYDGQKVDAHLHKVCPRNHRLVWCPLGLHDFRASDCYRVPPFGVPYTDRDGDIIWGSVVDWLYTHVPPLSALETVWKIRAGFPHALFFISDFVRKRTPAPRPDPFLAVSVVGEPFLIVDWWNEPGFKP